MFIGYIGTDSIGSLIKRFAAKKAGVEDEELTINVARSSICWRGRRESAADVRKPEIMVMTSLQAESYLLITPITLATGHAKPKTQINRRRTLPASFPLVGCLPQAAWPGKTSSPKSQDAVALQQIKERGALPMIDRGDIRQAIDRCSNIWASPPGAGYGRSPGAQGWTA